MGHVPRLSAEEPHGVRRVDHDGHALALSGVGGDELEVRVDAVGHGRAGRGERRLSHGVVLGMEDELDGVADGRVDRRWGVRETVLADIDLEGRGGHDGGEGEDCGGESEMHLLCFSWVSFKWLGRLKDTIIFSKGGCLAIYKGAFARTVGEREREQG
jgi:hypothetical protein